MSAVGDTYSVRERHLHRDTYADKVLLLKGSKDPADSACLAVPSDIYTFMSAIVIAYKRRLAAD